MAHALVHRIARLDDEFATPVARGLNEGIADYVQASMFDDPRFGDWVRAGQDGGRRCDDPSLRLPADPQDPDDRYRVGAAVAALLWDVRSELGRGVADAIVLHSLAFVVPGADYEAMRAALHLADATLFPARRASADTGRHRGVIDDAVGHRLS
jgi:hypothetical protein